MIKRFFIFALLLSTQSIFSMEKNAELDKKIETLNKLKPKKKQPFTLSKTEDSIKISLGEKNLSISELVEEFDNDICKNCKNGLIRTAGLCSLSGVLGFLTYKQSTLPDNTPITSQLLMTTLTMQGTCCASCLELVETYLEYNKNAHELLNEIKKQHME